MKRRTKKILFRLSAVMVIGMFLFALLGNASRVRTGNYFQSTKRAYWTFFKTDVYFWDASKKFNCLEAGVWTLPTVIGPVYYWIVRPIYDSVDLFAASPLWDILCLPRDYYLRHNFIFHLKITDEDGRALENAICELSNGKKGTSDANGIVRVETMSRFSGIGALVYRQGYYSHQEYPWPPMCRQGDRFLHTPKTVRMHKIIHQVDKVDVCKQLTNVMLTPRGFDCIAGDWIAPLGTGTVAHLYIAIDFLHWQKRTREMKVFFSLPENDESMFSNLIFNEQSDGTVDELRYKSWGLNDTRKKISNLSRNYSIPFAFRSHQTSTPDVSDLYGVIWSYGVIDENKRTIWFHYSYNKQPGEKSLEWTTPILHLKMLTDVSSDKPITNSPDFNPRKENNIDGCRRKDIFSKRIDVDDPVSGVPTLAIFGTDCKALTEEEAKNIDTNRYAILNVKVGQEAVSYSKDGKIKYSSGFKGGMERWHYERAKDEGDFWLYLDEDYIRVHKPVCKKFEKGRGRHCKMPDGGQFGDCCGGVNGTAQYIEEQGAQRAPLE